MRIPIFLDRDGVINKEPSDFGKDYITEIKYFTFLPKVPQALKKLIDAGYDIYIISNQAGVNKGIYSQGKLIEITRYMLQELEKHQIRIKDVKYCIHREEENCDCRKPKTKFLEEIFKNYKNLRKEYVFFIGDQERDIKTAFNFHINSILVLSGKTKIEEVSNFETKPFYIASNLYDAVRNIILK